MYITKQAGIGGEVTAHQDSAFLATEPVDTCVGIWLALQEATPANGCLWAIPGSHASGVAGRFVLDPLTRKTGWAEGKPPSLPQLAAEGCDQSSSYVPLPCPAGTLVVLHGAVVHASRANDSEKTRHALSVHYVEQAAEWSARNWMQCAGWKERPPQALE